MESKMHEEQSFNFADINLDFLNLDLVNQQQPNVLPENEFFNACITTSKLSILQSGRQTTKATQLARRIAETDILIQQIQTLKNEQLILRKKIESFQQSAIEIQQLYELEKSKHNHVQAELSSLKTEYDRLDSDFTNTKLHADQLQAHLDEETGPVSYGELAVKYFKLVQKTELVHPREQSFVNELRKFCEEKKISIPALKTSKKRVRINFSEKAIQCELVTKAADSDTECTAKKHTHTQGTQYIGTTTTRGTSTAGLIDQRHIGTCFPEIPSISKVHQILEEMVKWSARTVISPILDIPVESLPLQTSLRTIGTCTLLCNVQRQLDYLPGIPIKCSNSRPPSTSLFEAVKNESSTRSQTPMCFKNAGNANFNGFDQLPALANVDQNIFEELWQVFGHMLFGLLTRRDKPVNFGGNAEPVLNQQEFYTRMTSAYNNINQDRCPCPVLSVRVPRPEPRSCFASENTHLQEETDVAQMQPEATSPIQFESIGETNTTLPENIIRGNVTAFTQNMGTTPIKFPDSFKPNHNWESNQENIAQCIPEESNSNDTAQLDEEVSNLLSRIKKKHGRKRKKLAKLSAQKHKKSSKKTKEKKLTGEELVPLTMRLNPKTISALPDLTEICVSQCDDIEANTTDSFNIINEVDAVVQQAASELWKDDSSSSDGNNETKIVATSSTIDTKCVSMSMKELLEKAFSIESASAPAVIVDPSNTLESKSDSADSSTLLDACEVNLSDQNSDCHNIINKEDIIDKPTEFLESDQVYFNLFGNDSEVENNLPKCIDDIIQTQLEEADNGSPNSLSSIFSDLSDSDNDAEEKTDTPTTSGTVDLLEANSADELSDCGWKIVESDDMEFGDVDKSEKILSIKAKKQQNEPVPEIGFENQIQQMDFSSSIISNSELLCSSESTPNESLQTSTSSVSTDSDRPDVVCELQPPVELEKEQVGAPTIKRRGRKRKIKNQPPQECKRSKRLLAKQALKAISSAASIQEKTNFRNCDNRELPIAMKNSPSKKIPKDSSSMEEIAIENDAKSIEELPEPSASLSFQCSSQCTISECPASPAPESNTHLQAEILDIPLESKDALASHQPLLQNILRYHCTEQHKRIVLTVWKKSDRIILKELEAKIQEYIKADVVLDSDPFELVQKMLKISGNQHLIIAAIVKKMQDVERPERELSCPVTALPPRTLGTSHQRIGQVLFHLQGSKIGFTAAFLGQIENVLFRVTNIGKQSLEAILNLTQLYLVALSHQLRHMKVCAARLFIAKCLYFYNMKALPMIYEVLCIFPTVLPHREERSYDRGDPLISVIQHILMCTVYDITEEALRTKELLSKLRYEYHFEPFKPTNEEILQNLLEKLNVGKLNNIAYAFAILCKRYSPKRTVTQVLQPHLMPLASKYYQQALESPEHDNLIATLLDCISMIIKPFPVQTDIGPYLNIFIRFLRTVQRPIVQEAAVQAILRTQRFGAANCFNALLHFQPAYKLSHQTKAMLRTFLHRKPLTFWKTLTKQAHLGGVKL